MSRWVERHADAGCGAGAKEACPWWHGDANGSSWVGSRTGYGCREWALGPPARSAQRERSRWSPEAVRVDSRTALAHGTQDSGAGEGRADAVWDGGRQGDG